MAQTHLMIDNDTHVSQFSSRENFSIDPIWKYCHESNKILLEHHWTGTKLPYYGNTTICFREPSFDPQIYMRSKVRLASEVASRHLGKEVVFIEMGQDLNLELKSSRRGCCVYSTSPT